MRPSLSLRALALFAAVATATACADGALEEATAPSVAVADLGRSNAESSPGSGTGSISSPVDDDICFDVGGGARAEGSRIVLWQCHDGDNQQWTYTAAKELRIFGGTLCLDAPGARGENGDQLIVWSCHGGANQKWERTAAGELRGINGKCVDAAGGSLTVGIKVILYTCHGGANQKWNPPTATSASTSTTPLATPAPAPAPAAPVTPGVPAAPAPSNIPTDAAGKVFALMGAVPSVSAVEAQGAAFAKYEQDFRTYADRHWAQEATAWDQANYYDRAMIYYVWWARTGNTTYLERAHALVLDYRRNYVERNDYGVPPHWAMFDGLALHYLLTGDEASRTAVGRIADTFTVPYYVANLGSTTAEMENRMQARVLLGFVIANYIKAPTRTGQDWGVRARDALTKILASQAADGAYRMAGPINQCGYNKPFMVGLLNDAMIRYHTLFERDGRILTSIKKSVDYMWANDWRAGERAFVYLAGPCNGAPVGTAVDINNLVTSGFGFVSQQTGAATYRTRGDAVFSGGVYGTWLPGSKQFNQQYTSSYRYLALRQ